MPTTHPELSLLWAALPGLVRIMHNTFFTRIAAAGVAVAPLTLISALIWIDGSQAGQAGGQRERGAGPESTAQTEATPRRRPTPPQRPADPTLDGTGYSADALVFGRAGTPDSAPAPARSVITPTGLRGPQGESTEPGHVGDWAAGPASYAHAARHYGHDWITAPQAVWNAGQPGVSSAFAAPTGSSGSAPPTGSPNAPGNPQLFYPPENPVVVLTAASPGATPAESSAEPLALPAAPAITARDATGRAIPEPSTLGLALGALGLAGIGQRSRRPARRRGG